MKSGGSVVLALALAGVGVLALYYYLSRPTAPVSSVTHSVTTSTSHTTRPVSVATPHLTGAAPSDYSPATQTAIVARTPRPNW